MSRSNSLLTNKGATSIGYPRNKEEAYRKERYVLTFDFETNDLPHESVAWDNFEPDPTIRRWNDGRPMLDKITRKTNSNARVRFFKVASCGTILLHIV